MRVGVLSDSHDHLPNLRFALARLAEEGVSVVLHCGDLISPFVTRELGRFPGAVHTVFGNNDGDRFLAAKVAASEATNVVHHGEFAFVEVDGTTLGLSHYGEVARGFLASGRCDAAFHGHTHVHAQERLGDRLSLNPGELLGLLGSPAFCIYDTSTRAFERRVFEHRPW